ncbi:hypothetical protein PSYRMG_05725 [Pseudomonas syringae UMAF0158]|nr:hypothetical protein PSYRMG_05725 [Pseudomonas syringae UMAF0158]
MPSLFLVELGALSFEYFEFGIHITQIALRRIYILLSSKLRL